MKAETIKAIFTNLLFVIGVIFIIYGFIQGALTTVRLFTFEKYPLQTYEETRCDNSYPAIAMPYSPDASPPPPTDQDFLDQKAKCQESLNYERNVKKTEDIVVSITTLVAGTVLVLSFRRFIFK